MLADSVMLDQAERERFEKIKTETRRKEMLCIRALLKELAGEQRSAIHYNEKGKPFFKNSAKKLSVSHTKDMAAVIIDNNETGIDIQCLDPKIERIAHKFMNEGELKSIQDSNRKEQLSVYWCAKESLYKLYGNKNLDFRKNLSVDPFEYKGEGKISGSIIMESTETKYNLWYETIKNDTMLVYVLNSF